MSTREIYESATARFVEDYNKHAAQALQLERTNNAAAADMHVALSTIVAKYLSTHEKSIDPADRIFLRNEIVSRCMQALVLRSMQLSGFADLALSMSATRNLQTDIEKARRRLEEARRDDADGVDAEEEERDLDPRVHTSGLYEFIPYEQLDVSLSDLPGYEEQHRRIVNAYFVINGTREQSLRVDETVERKPRTRAGANVILYGPPGTGKTAAARAVARSLGLHLAFVNVENLLSAYRSKTEKNLRALYAKMRAIVRASGRNVVLLLDEVDGLVKNRNAGAGAVTSGEYSLLAKFLTILEPNDGKDNYGVFSIFTTNRLSNLDDAFRRRCSAVLMGYVQSSESRVRLFDTFVHDSVDYSTRTKRVEQRIADSCKFWVPGDHARFKKSLVDPYRLNKYFHRTGTTHEQFIAARVDGIIDRTNSSAAAGAKGSFDSGDSRDSREIFVDLPLLSYDEMFGLIDQYAPITPSFKYHEYLDDAAAAAANATASR